MTYQEVANEAGQDTNPLFEITGKLFDRVMLDFPPHLNGSGSASLQTLYHAFFHRPSRAIVIANRGAALLTRFGFNRNFCLTRHIGCAVYLPGHGVEMVDIGLVGNMSSDKGAVVRAESACAPSFLFESQRCNCHDQWLLTQELAASYHPAKVPITDTAGLEAWIMANQGISDNAPGFALLHFGSQNGMGSGATKGKFSPDLTATAWLRHRGEYTAEQVLGTSMSGGFDAIGLPPDPRMVNNEAGYRVIPIVMDFLGLPKSLTLLCNNLHKVAAVEKAGYSVRRIPLFGRVDLADEKETEERRDEFGHQIPAHLMPLDWQSELITLRKVIDG